MDRSPDEVVLTHERELTHATDLCLPGGRILNPGARGWSRVPLHNCNLAGTWGRKKRWDYWGVLTPTHAVSITYADVDYLGLTDVWWADLRDGRHGGRNRVVPGATGIRLPDRPGTAPLRSSARAQTIDITDDEHGTRLAASWTERHGTPARLDVHVALPSGHESLNVVIPWSDRRFQFTSKHQARPAVGELVIGDERVAIGAREPGGDEAWATLDVGRGRWPYRTR